MENKNGLQIQHQSLMTEYNMLKSELDELNTLYTEIKQEKDANKNTGSRLNYVFIAAQNSSLISIKTQRSNIISKMNDIRRNIEEIANRCHFCCFITKVIKQRYLLTPMYR